jgi:hypothetical protein
MRGFATSVIALGLANIAFAQTDSVGGHCSGGPHNGNRAGANDPTTVQYL